MAARLRSASWTKSPRARPPGPQKKKFTKIEQTFLLKLGQIKVWKKKVGLMRPLDTQI